MNFGHGELGIRRLAEREIEAGRRVLHGLQRVDADAPSTRRR